MERLTPEQRKLIHSANMAARYQASTGYINKWYYYYSKMEETFNNKQMSHYYGLTNYSKTRRKPQN